MIEIREQALPEDHPLPDLLVWLVDMQSSRARIEMRGAPLDRAARELRARGSRYGVVCLDQDGITLIPVATLDELIALQRHVLENTTDENVEVHVLAEGAVLRRLRDEAKRAAADSASGATSSNGVPFYVAEAVSRALAGGFAPGLVRVAEVRHDSSCPMLAGRGTCACRPEVALRDLTANERRLAARYAGGPL